MKTLAIKLDDEEHAKLVLVARLAGQTLADELRAAVQNHLEQRLSTGDLAAQAEKVLAEIDEEAASRRQAIEGLLNKRSKAPTSEKSSRGRKGNTQ